MLQWAYCTDQSLVVVALVAPALVPFGISPVTHYPHAKRRTGGGDLGKRTPKLKFRVWVIGHVGDTRAEVATNWKRSNLEKKKKETSTTSRKIF